MRRRGVQPPSPRARPGSGETDGRPCGDVEGVRDAALVCNAIRALGVAVRRKDRPDGPSVCIVEPRGSGYGYDMRVADAIPPGLRARAAECLAASAFAVKSPGQRESEMFRLYTVGDADPYACTCALSHGPPGEPGSNPAWE
jgi:hypothetical protein